MVEYKYDAWGKPVVVRTLTTAYEALAELNPFRYRGYVWDEETELYYLQDREYNPVIVRFSNGDRYIGFKKALSVLICLPIVGTILQIIMTQRENLSLIRYFPSVSLLLSMLLLILVLLK